MGTQAQAAPTKQSAPSVARQPILTADEKVVGYELSFQHNSQEQPIPPDIASETCAIIDTLNVIGLDCYAMGTGHLSTVRTRCYRWNISHCCPPVLYLKSRNQFRPMKP
jgi:hypothetical protein